MKSAWLLSIFVAVVLHGSLGFPQDSLTSAISFEEFEAQRKKFEGAIQADDLVLAGEIIQSVENFDEKPFRTWTKYFAPMNLGDAYKSRGDLKRARRYYKSSKGSDSCGTCSASLNVRRNIKIARTYDAQLLFPLSFWYYLKTLPMTGPSIFVLWGIFYSGYLSYLPFKLVSVVVGRIRKMKSRFDDGSHSE
jgi:hypothetical protein